MGGACKVLRFKVLVRLGPSALGVGSAGICLKGLELAVFRPAKIGLVEGLVLGYIRGAGKWSCMLLDSGRICWVG